MASEKENKKRAVTVDSLIHSSSYALLVCIIAASIFYGLKYFSVIKSDKFIEQNDNKADNESEATWANYKNDEYGFSVDYPLYLYPTEVEDPEGYLKFIIFEQTNFSVLKGMAIGITKSSLADEVSNVKKSIEKDGAAKLEEEKVGEKDGHATVLIRYSAQKTDDNDNPR